MSDSRNLFIVFTLGFLIKEARWILIFSCLPCKRVKNGIFPNFERGGFKGGRGEVEEYEIGDKEGIGKEPSSNLSLNRTKPILLFCMIVVPPLLGYRKWPTI